MNQFGIRLALPLVRAERFTPRARRFLHLVALLPGFLAVAAHAQAIHTATRAGELQVGGDLTFAVSHYLPVDIAGELRTALRPQPPGALGRRGHLSDL